MLAITLNANSINSLEGRGSQISYKNKRSNYMLYTKKAILNIVLQIG
jgi:hypothetical protein